MHYYIRIIAFILLFTCSACKDEVSQPKAHENDFKVLFIGNSLTYYHNMPGMFAALAEAEGKDVYVGLCAAGGAKLRDHAFDSVTIDAIQSEKWDYIILQGSDYLIVFPDSYPHLTTLDFLKGVIVSNCENTKIIFFLDYAMKGGVNTTNGAYSYNEFQDMIISGTKEICSFMDFGIAPIGCAWKTIMNENESINLYDPDRQHPSLTGSYLQACVYYSSVFLESVEGNSYMGNLSSVDVAPLQKAAADAVLDNLDQWNLQ